MSGRRSWLLAAALALPLAAGAKDGAATSVPQLEGESFGSEDGGRVTVARKARFMSGDAELSADLIRMDVAAGTIVAEGNVAYTSPKLRLLGERARVDARAGVIEAENVRLGRFPAHFFAGRFRMEKGNQVMTDVLAWRNEPSDLGMAVRAGEVRYVGETDRLTLDDVEPLLAGVPLLHIPHYGQKGYRDLPVEVYLRVRDNDRQGVGIQTTVTVAADGPVGRGLLLDGYTKSGILVGPSLSYDNREVAGREMTWVGSLMGGYIQDRSDLASRLDDYGRIPDEHRFFVLADAVGNRPDGLHVAAQLQSLSDPEVMEDFRSRLRESARFPQTFAEVSSPLAGGRASLLVSGKTDDFQAVVERLPEVRWDLAETALGSGRLRGRGWVSVARLGERPSENLPLVALLPGQADFTSVTGATGSVEVTRLDGYAGLAQTIPHADWLSIRPILGVRSTWWDEGLGGGAVGRTLVQAGFDAEATATGSWELESPRWGVRGLRHTLRPFLGWRAYPELDGARGEIARLDRSTLTDPNLPMLDLADRRDTDTLDDRQAAQVGIRNSLETRDAAQGTREILRADFLMDWREPRASGEEDHSLYTHLAWKPAGWLSLETLLRTSGESDETTGALTWATVRSGDLWQLSFGYTDLRQDEDENQAFGFLDLRLNSAHTLRVGATYDLVEEAFLERRLTLVQKIGASWDLEYGLSSRRSRLDVDRLSFTVRVRLFKF